MNAHLILSFIVTVLLVPCVTSAQEATSSGAPMSDAQAISVLTQAVNASGIMNPVKPILDFAATGTITYFWAGEQVSGPVTVRGRGPDQFRIDANLPEGTRSWAVSRGVGARREMDGRLGQIPFHNTINLGVVTFPQLTLAVRVNEPTSVALTVGTGVVNGRQVNQIRVQRLFPKEQDPDGTISKLATTDYFVDADTGFVIKTLDLTHSDDDLKENFTHEVEFENYTVKDGVNIPTLIREKIIGQTIWELRLINVAFNSGLTDLDFILQ